MAINAAARMPHYMQRIEERMPDLAPRLLDIARSVESLRLAKDTAVLVHELPALRGDTQANILDRASNGDQVWAIVRGGRVVTMMFRRSTQPATAEAMRVEQCKRIAKGAK